MRTFRGSSFCREPSDGDCGFGWFNVYNLRRSLEIASSQRANRTVAATTPGSAGACGLFADHRFVANRAMATAVSGGLSCTTSAEVLRSHRASELTGQSPLPLLGRPGHADFSRIIVLSRTERWRLRFRVVYRVQPPRKS